MRLGTILIRALHWYVGTASSVPGLKRRRIFFLT